MLKPLNQVLSSLVDQEAGQQIESDMNFEGSYPVEEYEVRIMEPERSGGPWQSRATIPMQSSENALTVRVVTLYVSLGSSCLSISVCVILLLYRYFIWSKVYIYVCMSIYIISVPGYRIPLQEKTKLFWQLGLLIYKERMLLQGGVCYCTQLKEMMTILRLW